jgi:hypothetical protein
MKKESPPEVEILRRAIFMPPLEASLAPGCSINCTAAPRKAVDEIIPL